MENLRAFAMGEPRSFLEILTEARQADVWYLFACCGINLTVMLATQANRDKESLLDPLFVHLHKEPPHQLEEQDVLDTFHSLYMRTFKAFHRFWHSCGARSVMEFEERLRQFFKPQEKAVNSVMQAVLEEEIHRLSTERRQLHDNHEELVEESVFVMKSRP